ncbi:hypothetical protein BZG36_03296 [Bifiguratus adelaidae]|uniref:Sodium/calcium exchanger membrane region domain-containing protein n=1 Tax=Bifiguratus adelaidae TaxID=1938954 RepID=A0A261XZE0_9FUNG|nr:hypothetical protein BZG36_03296 [Bifiguratus adelaidae]
MWAAVFALLIVWTFLLILADSMKQRRLSRMTAISLLSPGDPTTLIGAEAGHPEPQEATQEETRLIVAAGSARDAFLMLLAATLVTTAGYGATPATVTLAWLYTVFVLVWIFTILFDGSPVVCILMEILAIPLILSMFTLAFREQTRRP